MAILKPRDKRTKTRRALSVADCTNAGRVAAERVAYRERRDQLTAHYAALATVLRTTRTARGPVDFVDDCPTSAHAWLVYELQVEIANTRDELRGLLEQTVDVATSTDVEIETVTALLDAGASAYQVGQLVHGRAVADGAARKHADRRKRTRVAEIDAQLEVLPTTSGDLMIDIEGLGPMIVPGPQPWEARRADLEARRARLTIDRRSSSTKRPKRRG